MGKCGELAIGPENILVKNLKGTWVAQSMKCPTLDFCSGHDLGVVRLSPRSVQSLIWDLSRPLPLPPASLYVHVRALSQKERERTQRERGRKRSRERRISRLCTEQHRTRHGTWSRDSEILTWAEIKRLNWLSNPAILSSLYFRKQTLLRRIDFHLMRIFLNWYQWWFQVFISHILISFK